MLPLCQKLSFSALRLLSGFSSCRNDTDFASVLIHVFVFCLVSYFEVFLTVGPLVLIRRRT